MPLLAFTPYVAALSALPVIVAAALRRWAPAAVALMAAVALAVTVLPRAFAGGAPAVGDAVTLRVLTTNLEYGRGDPEVVAGLVEELDVDLLSVQELTPDAIAPLRRALGGALPEAVLAPAETAGGGGLFAAHRLSEGSAEQRLAGGFFLPSARLHLPGAARLEVFSVHTVPPTSSGIDNWGAGLDALPAPGDETLRVLAGDFNATLDHAELRDLIDSGYRDAADAAGAGLATTWPNGRRFPPMVTIDHVLADERAGVGEVSVHRIPHTDHRAVFAELEIPPELTAPATP